MANSSIRIIRLKNCATLEQLKKFLGSCRSSVGVGVQALGCVLGAYTVAGARESRVPCSSRHQLRPQACAYQLRLRGNRQQATGRPVSWPPSRAAVSGRRARVDQGHRHAGQYQVFEHDVIADELAGVGQAVLAVGLVVIVEACGELMAAGGIDICLGECDDDIVIVGLQVGAWDLGTSNRWEEGEVVVQQS